MGSRVFLIDPEVERFVLGYWDADVREYGNRQAARRDLARSGHLGRVRRLLEDVITLNALTQDQWQDLFNVQVRSSAEVRSDALSLWSRLFDDEPLSWRPPRNVEAQLRDAFSVAESLQGRFADSAEMQPLVATYSWVCLRLFHDRPAPGPFFWRPVVHVASRTTRRFVGDLGPLALDAFIVAAKSGRTKHPSWWSAEAKAAWRTTFQSARVLRDGDAPPWEEARV